MTTRVMRPEDWSDPPRPVHREVLTAHADPDSPLPPVLFVPGFGHGAWVYAEHWLEHTAERGFPAYAMSLRGHGASGPDPDADLRAYVHDVVQVAAALPRRSVLVGAGAGALVVAMALARYPARAGVLVAPAFGGMGAGFTALRRNPGGTLPGLFGRPVRLRGSQLFSPDLPDAAGRSYVSRLGGASGRAQRQLVRRHEPEPAVGDPPVLVLGSPDDRVVARTELERVARRYGGAPLLFPGMGHDVMLDARWQEPIEAMLDWLEKACA
jgi:pimeloyl-ACP methyl ester carboxylesterase